MIQKKRKGIRGKERELKRICVCTQASLCVCGGRLDWVYVFAIQQDLEGRPHTFSETTVIHLRDNDHFYEPHHPIYMRAHKSWPQFYVIGH